ncbi:hypothetical protein [Streptomyces prunicolor]|uniref:hypothetical protein n=1 Tax=Streptomyces prunicolor TaxID=67348 RepID=UPI0003A69F69|nr:hypothetical protein [Streptomyces prunicolor]
MTVEEPERQAAGRPLAKSVSSSPLGWSARRGGPYPHLRLDLGIKATEGLAVAELVLGRHWTFRRAAASLGMSPTTAWRRYWWLMDWMLPQQYGLQARRLPPMRGTRACARGRPYIHELDGPGGPLHRGEI